MRLALAGMFVCALGYAAFVTPAVRRDGWIAMTPTSVLVVLASPQRLKEIAFDAQYSTRYPPTAPLGHPIEYELVRRGEEGAVYDWQADVLAWRIGRAHNSAGVSTVFRSYDIAAMLAPAWWSSPIPFTDDDRTQVYWRSHELLTRLADLSLWSENGGDEASLFRAGNRLFVWAPRLEQQAFESVLTLLVTKGQGAIDRVRIRGWYREGQESHEIRMYDVADIAPPNVHRYVKPPPDPHTDIQWAYLGGELILRDEAMSDLYDDITLNVRMYDWIDNGGMDATFYHVPGWLIIWASPEMHDLVAERIELHRTGKIGQDAGPP